jgi:hypothetical protein
MACAALFLARKQNMAVIATIVLLLTGVVTYTENGLSCSRYAKQNKGLQSIQRLKAHIKNPRKTFAFWDFDHK